MIGLLNKTIVELLIRERITSTSGIPCALVIADIDNLKPINDVFGHSLGDEAILTISEILYETLFNMCRSRPTSRFANRSTSILLSKSRHVVLRFTKG